MAHNSYIHGGPTDPTAWLPGFVPSQLDWQTFDKRQFESINGDQGGTWAPSDRITIGGSGFEVSTNFYVTGTGQANFYGGLVTINPSAGVIFAGVQVDFDASTSVTFENGFDVLTGNVDIDAGHLTVTAGNLDVTAGTLHVGGAVSLDASLLVATTLSVLGASSLNTVTAASYATSGSGVVATGSTLVTAGGTTTTFNGPVTLANAMTVTNTVITFSGTGRILDRMHTLPDADATVTIADGNYFIIPALGALRAYTMSTSGAVVGDIVCFSAWENATANAASIGVWNLTNVSGQPFAVRFRFNGSTWVTLDLSVRP